MLMDKGHYIQQATAYVKTYIVIGLHIDIQCRHILYWSANSIIINY